MYLIPESHIQFDLDIFFHELLEKNVNIHSVVHLNFKTLFFVKKKRLLNLLLK